MTSGIALKMRTLRVRALSLGSVKVFDHAMQFLLPVVLVRCLDTATFGEYRLLWLVIGTFMSIATLNMSQSLYYFLPRSDAPKKRLYIHQTFLFLLFTGAACAALVGPWNPFLPATIEPLGKYGALVPTFLALWVASEMMDLLPTVDERIRWQAYASITVAVLRVALVGVGAWASGDLAIMLWLLIAVVGVKLLILAAYVRRHHGVGKPWFDRHLFADQFRYAAPLGLAASLYALRKQADSWVAAILFPIASFGAFSIAAMLSPLVYVFRASVIQAFLPSMSRLQAAGDVKGMMQMNRASNVLVASLLYPILAFVFVFAEDIITFVYTAAYVDAAPVMRVYIVGFAALSVDVGSVIGLLRQGPFVLGVNAVAIVLSAAISYALAGRIGLAGAAAGSVVVIYLDRALTLRRIKNLIDVGWRQLQDWRGLATALGYAVASAALAWAAANFIAETTFYRLLVGGLVLALAYVPILLRWRSA